MFNMRKTSPLIKIFNNTLIDMPAPVNISYMWNFGSLLGLSLLFQILTGLFLAFHYSNSIEQAFSSVVHICHNVNYGWLLRTLHANGASLFFIMMYLHVGRGIYFGSFYSSRTWYTGVTILLLSMATAFLGYVLPWGQMSFWGATVITNLLSTVPYLGDNLVEWLWGGFAVDSATLTRFFSFHFVLPFVILALIMIHIFFLHQTGSSNPLGLKSNCNKVPFHPYFTFKDILGFLIFLTFLAFLTLIIPYGLGDPENFNQANPLVTPPHIQPEWYYLFAYAILRSIPNKLGGVVSLFMSIFILYLLPTILKKKMQSNQFYPISKFLFWSYLVTLILLTWVGACPVESPFISTSQILTVLYFSYFLVDPVLINFWDNNI